MPNKKFIKPYKKDSPEYAKILDEFKYQGIHLIVKNEFNGLKKGRKIKRYSSVKKIMSSQHVKDVLKINR